ncbi:MAG: hypothetical protein C7B43_19995 [Sulfobacillus benefaciens]|uniref:DUF4406 domain-containing protein n=1 Tax=Sulfobacillus benefaciens TaxID=453960 RepID=A0A2T2WMV5_9FIRM|nr:MAG: hypothetical protein C7B43_19995 [Sulfobacillus benefaciens]
MILMWYLSGPMSGHPAFNFPLFHRAAAAFRQHGVAVVNPAEICSVDTTWSVALAQDLAVLPQTQGLILLPGWQTSSGARLEWQWARAHGLPRLLWSDAWTVLCPAASPPDLAWLLGAS